jgi:tetratricopeptide (TPR) repeat protein
MTDRRTNVTVTSNRVGLSAGPEANPAAADLWNICINERGDRALQACTEIIDARSELPLRLAQAYTTRALLHQHSAQPDKAIADLGRAIELMREAGKSGFELAFIYFMRANVHRAKGDLDLAIADHTESIRVAPTWDKSYNDRGAIYFQKGDLARALDDISKVISFRPDSPRVAESYAIRGLLHLRLGEPARGLPDADRAIALNSRSAMALYIRSRIYESLGRKDEAEADMRAALAIAPGIKQQMQALDRAGRP